jgi:hypothetical protein
VACDLESIRDQRPGGVSGDALRPDNLVYDITSQAGQKPGVSKSGWGHPKCGNTEDVVAASLPSTRH